MKQYPYNQNISLTIPTDYATLNGDLFIPEQSNGLVIFVHGSGSSRLSPRNQYVATALNQLGLATLLFDLLTVEEEKIDNVTAEYRFDIPLLSQRLMAVTDWISQRHPFAKYKIGYFGASTGAAAALIAAAVRPALIDAVVSRGGRPDLADEYLSQIKAPTLLIVGSLDHDVILLNREAQKHMQNHNELILVSGATHLFEEDGALDQVIGLTQRWLLKYLK